MYFVQWICIDRLDTDSMMCDTTNAASQNMK